MVLALTPALISAAKPGDLPDYRFSLSSYRDFLLLKHFRNAKQPDAYLCFLTRTSGDMLCEILEAIFDCIQCS